MWQQKAIAKSNKNNNNPVTIPASARNLRKSDLGAVIFGCKHNTISECHSKQLFGLPGMHFSYVRNIEEGLPLFLFNYTDRKLHGIYEAAGPGQLNADSYAWTDGGSERTPCPAQVPVRIKIPCIPLEESEFKKVIKDNYYEQYKFWFELDHAQARSLIALFRPSPFPINLRPPPVIISAADPGRNLCNDKGGSGKGKKEVLAETKERTSSKTSSNGFDKAQKTALGWMMLVEELEGDDKREQDLNARETQNCTEDGKHTDYERVLGMLKNIAMESSNSDASCSRGAQEINDAPGSSNSDSSNNNNFPAHDELLQALDELKERALNLERKQVEWAQEIEWLRDTISQSGKRIQQLTTHVRSLESKLDPSLAPDSDDSLYRFVEQCLGSEDVIYLIGGSDGHNFLDSIDSFSPSLDVLTPLRPMSRPKSYTSAAMLYGKIYVIGGGDSASWFDTVESYDRRNDEWAPQPSLNIKRGNLSAVSLNGKIYALGGGNSNLCFSEVEMFDPVLGKWINHLPMLQKRCGLAGVVLNDVIYTVGGFEGNHYLSCGEKFDPREPYWKKIPSMSTSRGSLSLAVLNEKIYAIGGYDGTGMVRTVEFYDPRMPSCWVPAEPMNCARVYVASAVLGGSLYSIGGIINDNLCSDIVECYKEGHGWIKTGLKSIGNKCYSSAIVL